MIIRWRVGLSILCLLLILSGCGAKETVEGYQTITPVLVGNSDEFASVEEIAEEGTEVTIGDKLIKVNA